MPVYNGEGHLRDAVDSILNQTYRNFEFIIVDDGSTDRTASILDGLKDDRIVRIDKVKNGGIVLALNEGISVAQGAYIARQDADDIAEPTRLETQMAYIKRHPEVGLLGSAYTQIDGIGNDFSHHFRVSNNLKLKWKLLFANQFTHSSVVFNTTLAQQVGLYDESDIHAEDYGLWCRMAKRTKISNINKALVKYRVSPNNITGKWIDVMKETVWSISLNNFNRLIDMPDRRDAIYLLLLIRGGKAKENSSWDLEKMIRNEIGTVHTHVVPRLIRCFCDTNTMSKRTRVRFYGWATNDLAKSIISTVNFHIKDRTHLSRAALLLLWWSACRISRGGLLKTLLITLVRILLCGSISHRAFRSVEQGISG